MEIDINKLLGKRFYRRHSLWHFRIMAPTSTPPPQDQPLLQLTHTHTHSKWFRFRASPHGVCAIKTLAPGQKNLHNLFARIPCLHFFFLTYICLSVSRCSPCSIRHKFYFGRQRNTRTTNLTIGLSENFNMFLSRNIIALGSGVAHYHNLALTCINSDFLPMCAKSCRQEYFFILSFFVRKKLVYA